MHSNSYEHKNEMGGKTLASQRVYEGRTLSIRVDKVQFRERISTREIVIFPKVAAIVSLLPNSKIILVEQYRYPVRRKLLEIPAGKVKLHEDPITAARRELEEETGYRANRMEEILRFYTAPGYSTEIVHLFKTTDLEHTHENPSDDEFIKVKVIGLNEALRKIVDGSIIDAKSIIGIHMIWRHHFSEEIHSH